jgi:hypothetical protein
MGIETQKIFMQAQSRNGKLITLKKLKMKNERAGALNRILAKFSLSITEGCLRLRELLRCGRALKQ